MDVYKFPLRIKNSKVYKLTIGVYNRLYGLAVRILIPKISLGVQNLVMVLGAVTKIRFRTQIRIVEAFVKIQEVIHSTIRAGKTKILVVVKEIGRVLSTVKIPKIIFSTVITTIGSIKNVNIRIPKISFNANPWAYQFYTVAYHSAKTIDQMDDYEFNPSLQSRLEDIYRKTLGER